ncbi:isochorismatase family protein [Pedobacter nototheniae]|uniref:isochorismatase family protein n=1 Tax=Pedobacter nototheniae TaxID=2488994 RepID=UPI00292E9603|nr:isochorismatase family protein [Pedobacter nototheniae]
MVTSLDKNTALVLIDLQKGIVNFPLAKPVHEVLEKASQLVSAFREAGLPIVVVNVDPTHSPLNELRKDAPSRAMTFPDEWYEITPEIKTISEDIFITKSIWNAFTNPNLDAELKKRKVTGIVIAGVSTSIGVEGTARNASELGYNLTFARDAMADTIASAHEHSIQIIFPRLGEVDDTEKIIQKLAEL